MRKGPFIILFFFFLLLLPSVKNQSMAGTCFSPPVKIVGDEYKPTSIQDAYDNAITTQTSFTLKLASGDFTEDLLFDGGAAVILDGGYDISDSSFTSKTSPTAPSSILGKITISTGSLTVAADTDFPKIISPLPECAFVDNDGDGFTSIGSCAGRAEDCDDSNAGINPGAVDIPNDGIDQDCSGLDLRFAEDNLPNEENCGRCHGISPTQWDDVHVDVTAPDTTCAACHNALVNNILSGHYGQTVRTADMSGDETIVCNSCHDQISAEHNFGNNTVMAKVFAAWNSFTPITCDTCHENRAAEHATGVAHNDRNIDNSCGQCHIPLATQADVDTLHRSDCALCHNYSGTAINAGLVQQAIEDGINGSPVTCTDCHAAHHSSKTNQVNYDPNADTSQPTPQGCVNCHYDYDIANGTSLGLSTWETILVEHDLDGIKDGSSNTCANCHNYDGSGSAPLADVQNAIASGSCVSCATCHTDKAPNFAHGSPTSGKHERHLQLPGNISCATCHSSAPFFQSGTDSNVDGLYDLAETDVCNPCHQDWDSGLAVERDYKAGWSTDGFTLECNYCHAESVDNGDNTPTGGRRAVEGEFPVGNSHAHYGAVLDPTSCQVCHDHTNHSDGMVNLLDPDGGTEYSFIYPTDLTSDPDLSNFCSNCHDANGATRLVAPLNPLDPFANGNVPPDVATRFMGTLQWSEWYGDSCFGSEGSERHVNSHHDISDADQALSGAKIECLDCHGAHTSAANQKLTDPFAENVAWAGTLNEFCLSCHTGDHGPNDLILPSEVSVPAFYTAPPANIPGEDCGTGMVYDCAGSCVAQATINGALTNGTCNDQSTPVLDCNIFNFDGGDCRPLNTPNTNCGTGMVYDCADNCVAQATVDTALANGTCDEVATLDLSCAAFNYDYEACNPCVGNDCSSIGGIDSCNYDFAPWWIDAAWKNTPHGPSSKRQWAGYSGSDPVPEMDCVVCHDSHGSYDAVVNPGGNPYMLRDYVDGSQFNDDGIRGAVTNVPGTPGPVVITNPTPTNIGPQLGDELCVKCHATWLNAYSWHAYCNGCLTCHSHGMAYDSWDWGGAPADHVPCP